MKKLLSALSAAALIAVMTTGVALANHAIAGDTVAPNSNNHTGNGVAGAGGTFGNIPGNVTCGGVGVFQLKIEAEDINVGETYGWFGGFFGVIEITAYDGKHISWKITEAFDGDGEGDVLGAGEGVDANLVLVKGGPNTMGYSYDTLDDWDTNLTAPRNPNGAQPKYYGISHISFCFDPKA